MFYRRFALAAAVSVLMPFAALAQEPVLITDENAPPVRRLPTPEELAGGQQGGNPVVTIKTTKGNIKLQLDADKAPGTVANFMRYVDEGFYNGTIFHRVIDNFMIQGGGFAQDMTQKPTHEPIKNEADNGLKNTRGTVAMARTMVVDSATAQFFINVVDNPYLDFQGKTPDKYGYCVFGKVIEGMDVIDAIKSVPTGNKGPHQNVPAEPIVILEVTRG
jgi:cyclophilin family peptidyl-prolyl cis-trans isomerase